MIRTASVLMICLLVTGCSPPEIDIAFVRSNGRPTIRFSQEWGIVFSHRQVPCIDTVEVYEQKVDGSLVWRIEALGVQCLDLELLLIGHAPLGFTETFALTRPPRGRHSVIVEGIGSGVATLTF